MKPASLTLLSSAQASEQRFMQVKADAASLSDGDQARLMALLSTDLLLKHGPEVNLSNAGLLEFCRAILALATTTAQRIPTASEASLKVAIQLLEMKEGLTGPDRAVIAAAKLFHTGKSVATARAINTANDECKGDFISNITTAIAAAVRERFLEVVENDNPEGHNSYKLTAEGFLYVEMKRQRHLVSRDRGQGGTGATAA